MSAAPLAAARDAQVARDVAEVTATPGKAAYARAPFDWYVEEQWVTEALIASVETDSQSIGGFPLWGRVWDPACGSGNVLKAFAAQAIGRKGWASDIEFRGFAANGVFHQQDFLAPIEEVRAIMPRGRDLSIVCNPPFSYVDNIAEAFVRRALALATIRVAMLLPIKWQGSLQRERLFTEHPPTCIHVLSQRPSMPPGALIAEMGKAAFRRGLADYCWFEWNLLTPARVGETRWRTIPKRERDA